MAGSKHLTDVSVYLYVSVYLCDASDCVSVCLFVCGQAGVRKCE